MTAVAASTKSYFIGPQDGWTQIVTGTTNFLRVSGYPHTHPFQIAAASSKPAQAIPGITVCHSPFTVHDDTNGMTATFWIKVNNPANQNNAGRVRIDVFCEGGTLS